MRTPLETEEVALRDAYPRLRSRSSRQRAQDVCKSDGVRAQAGSPTRAVPEVIGYSESGEIRWVGRVDDVVRCRIIASELFQSREQLTAVLIAKADKWIAAQAGFGPLN